MKKFNKVISIEVSVDGIAQRLLEIMDKENPHRELITEEIIGNLEASGRLGGVYNALNGWGSEIDIVVGGIYDCSGNHYTHVNKGTEELPEWVEEYIPDNKVKVISVDKYKQNGNIEVHYDRFNSKGEHSHQTKWVSHTKLTAVIA